jgi:DNA-directed RNA polymerase specialized sigma24 family protein
MAEVRHSANFPSTRRSRVIVAADHAAPEASDALAALCQAYWYPIYVFIRCRRRSSEEACDLTQDYFTRLLEKPVFAAADRTKGRFRAFLKTDCQHFLIDKGRRKRVRAHVLKTVSIDAEDAETRPARSGDPGSDPRVRTVAPFHAARSWCGARREPAILLPACIVRKPASRCRTI